jgi:urea transport system permease protein
MSMSMSIVFNQLFAGLSMASILLMIGLGLAIIYGAMGVINLAHGEFVMLGAYGAWALQSTFGLSILASLPIVFVAVALIGLIIEKTIIRRLYSRPLDTILATWGIGIVIQQLVRLGIGADSKFVKGPELLSGNLHIGDVVMPNYRIFVIFFAISMLLITWCLMNKTEFGTKLRAVIQNREISECYGIDAKNIFSITFAYGAGLAGLAGVLLTPLISTIPTMGTGLVVDSFLTVIVGGVGSIFGTAAAAVLVGEGSAMFSLIMNDTLGRIAVLFVIILLIRFKPNGLVPGNIRR